MLHHVQAFAKSVPDRRLKRHYVVTFFANQQGEEKRLEFYSPDAVQALHFALHDRARRSVEVWENGEFLCRVERELTTLECGRRPSS